MQGFTPEGLRYFRLPFVPVFLRLRLPGARLEFSFAPTRSVDVIFCMSVVHHLEIPRVRDEMRRVLTVPPGNSPIGCCEKVGQLAERYATSVAVKLQK